MTDMDFLLAVIAAHDEDQPIRGRSYVHAVCYLASRVLGIGPWFQGQFFGPYSPPIADALGTMVSWGILSITTRYVCGVRQETFNLEELGYAEEKGRECGEEFHAIKLATQRVLQVKAVESNDALRLTAKIDWLLRNKLTTSGIAGIIKEARAMGWGEVGPEVVASSLAELELLNPS